MDEVARYNRARWKALAGANALFTRPKMDLDDDSARRLIDPNDQFGDLSGREVLCLASGGGQQSAAFALLGARVTVFDLSAEQLERDALVAERYGFDLEIAEGDMRDLSRFREASFDIVHHAYSINFVPDAREVFRQVARVLREGGIYQFQCANPFTVGVGQSDWNGAGYVLKRPYRAGEKIDSADQQWVFDRENCDPVPNPVEYRHTLSDLLNGLIGEGFVIAGVSDDSDMFPDEESEPGSWDHFVAFAPPWLCIRTVYRPDLKI
ncbi:MAG: class I SAM-dependent methyltransferase [Pyrinomonadaceae bacterium]